MRNCHEYLQYLHRGKCTTLMKSNSAIINFAFRLNGGLHYKEEPIGTNSFSNELTIFGRFHRVGQQIESQKNLCKNGGNYDIVAILINLFLVYSEGPKRNTELNDIRLIFCLRKFEVSVEVI